MASFQLRPLNAREAVHYPEGTVELIRRQTPTTKTAMVWVLTPDDIEALKIALELHNG